MHAIDFSKLKTPDSTHGRERTEEMIRQYHKAQENLEKVCHEKGLVVPVLVCESS